MLLPAGSLLVALVFLLVVGLVVALVVWGVSSARRTAERSGMHVNGATATGWAPGRAEPADRLRRLQSLLADGLITQAEHDERRRAIIDEV